MSLENPERCGCENEKFDDFYFRKHCLVACLMDVEIPADAPVFVFDADNIPTNLDADLSPWMASAKSDDFPDLMLYERCTVNEIAAGNYMAKNTRGARAFLRSWAALVEQRPVTIFTQFRSFPSSFLLVNSSGSRYPPLRDVGAICHHPIGGLRRKHVRKPDSLGEVLT